MKIALICLPHYLHTKRLILQQLSTLGHEFYIFEESRGEGGFDGLKCPPNTIFVPLPKLDHALLVEHLASKGIEQVISFSDRGLLPAARLRRHFGMQGNSVETETWVVDKGAMRQRLTECGLSGISFKLSTVASLVDAAADQPMPLIVKPTRMSGSLCVELIESPEGLQGYVERCHANKVFSGGELIIEEYMPGKEFSVEGVVVRGSIHFLGVTESHTSGAPFFVGTGHDFFARHPDAQRIETFIADVIHCLKFENCPFHIEAKYTKSGYEVVEVHSRYGGAMIMELVEHATGFHPFSDYIELLSGASPRPVKEADGNIYSQHLLAVGEGVIDRIRLDIDLSKDERVISYAIDYADGDVIERDILPVNYVGYITFKARSVDEANAFRAFVDQHLTVNLH